MKQRRIDEARGIFFSCGIPFTEHNGGIHFRLDGEVDYWPTTTKFRCERLNKSGYGSDDAIELVKQLRKKSPPLHTIKVPSGLNSCQRDAFLLLASDDNVFLTGKAGTGKSYLISKFLQSVDRLRYPVIAPTGVAAQLVGGVTIHSFFKFGLAEGDDAVRNALGKADMLFDKFGKIDGLIIDEISMVSNELLRAMEKCSRKFRGNDEPWGGLKIIVVGDFRQLKPVRNTWAFEDDAWARSEFKLALLKTPVRQTDKAFTDVLNSVRMGRVTPEVETFLNSRVISEVPDDFDGAILYPTNVKVDAINLARLHELPGAVTELHTQYDGSEKSVEVLKKMVPEVLSLKVGARIMMRRNDVNGSYVNGSLGVVTRISAEGLTIDLMIGSTIWVEPIETPLLNDSGTPIASAIHFPVCLAWATTIHKSQGCTLDKVYIDLRNLWEYGQAYVALSRARNAEGLFLKGWDRGSIKSDPVVDRFHVEIFNQTFSEVTHAPRSVHRS